MSYDFASRRTPQMGKVAARIMEFTAEYDRLVVAYEDLTRGGRSVRYFPEEESHRICRFLGVEERVLETPLVKGRPEEVAAS